MKVTRQDVQLMLRNGTLTQKAESIGPKGWVEQRITFPNGQVFVVNIREEK